METRSIQVPNALLIAEVRRAISEGHSATFRVKGNSMRPFLETERDIVKIERVEPKDVKVRDVVLAEIAPQKYVLHRVDQRNGSTLILRGDGNVKGTEQCRDTDVVGIATAFYRKGRNMDCPDLVTGWKWRTYSSIWLALKPFRRILLGLYRRQPFRL